LIFPEFVVIESTANVKIAGDIILNEGGAITPDCLLTIAEFELRIVKKSYPSSVLKDIN
jgi:hypothetical protein